MIRRLARIARTAIYLVTLCLCAPCWYVETYEARVRIRMEDSIALVDVEMPVAPDDPLGYRVVFVDLIATPTRHADINPMLLGSAVIRADSQLELAQQALGLEVSICAPPDGYDVLHVKLQGVSQQRVLAQTISLRERRISGGLQRVIKRCRPF
ncbi:MAG: hypothetical protein AAF610_00540 [Pseudomonadota bacterium]